LRVLKIGCQKSESRPRRRALIVQDVGASTAKLDSSTAGLVAALRRLSG
jgi:hypothetical protein